MILNSCQGFTRSDVDPFWLFLHEFGHALGLEHPFPDEHSPFSITE